MTPRTDGIARIVQWFYYTRAGTCGGSGYSNSAQVRYEHSMSAEYAGPTANVTSTIATVTSTSTLAANASTTALASAQNTTSLMPTLSPAQNASTTAVSTTSVAATVSGGSNDANIAANGLAASTVAPSTSSLQGGASSMFNLPGAGIVLGLVGALAALL